MPDQTDQQKTGRYYKYDPSQAASAIFAVLYGLSTIYHGYQLGRWRTWYFIPFFAGGLFQVFGYITRCVSIAQKPDYEKGPYIVQQILILLAPALYAASIYMVLGRLMLLLQAESYAVIRRSWMTKIFVSGDVVSIVVQGAGGAMMGSATSEDTQKLGSNVVVGGLFVQLIIFGLFIAVTALFHHRIEIRPTVQSKRLTVPWRRYILILYGASALIMTRSIFRAVEFIQGNQGALMKNEAYTYGFDSALMFLVFLIFNVFHPNTIISNPDRKYDTPLRIIGTSDSDREA